MPTFHSDIQSILLTIRFCCCKILRWKDNSLVQRTHFLLISSAYLFAALCALLCFLYLKTLQNLHGQRTVTLDWNNANALLWLYSKVLSQFVCGLIIPIQKLFNCTKKSELLSYSLLTEDNNIQHLMNIFQDIIRSSEDLAASTLL